MYRQLIIGMGVYNEIWECSTTPAVPVDNWPPEKQGGTTQTSPSNDCYHSDSISIAALVLAASLHAR
jgi:hypothetical protein